MVKNLPANSRDRGSIPVLGRSPGEGKGNPLQCSSLENSICLIGQVSYFIVSSPLLAEKGPSALLLPLSSLTLFVFLVPSKVPGT